MIALDSNILLRLTLHDDEQQLALIVRFMESNEGERYFIPDIVWVEVVWTLLRAARWRSSQIAVALRRIEGRSDVEIEDADRFAAAVEALEDGEDFADRLIVETARRRKCSGLLSLDQALRESQPEFVVRPE